MQLIRPTNKRHKKLNSAVKVYSICSRKRLRSNTNTIGFFSENCSKRTEARLENAQTHFPWSLRNELYTNGECGFLSLCTVCISAVDGEECLMEAAKTTLDSEICKEKEKEIENALIRLQLAEKDKNREKKASAYKDLTWLYHVVEDYKQSITYGEKLLSISTKMRNKELQANACHVLAWAHKNVEDYEKGEDFCSQLLRIGKELKDERLKASAHEVQAWLCFSKKNYTKSSQEGKKFRNASTKLGDKRLEAKALMFYPGPF